MLLLVIYKESFKRADLVLGFVVTLAVSLSCYGNWNLYLWVYRFCSVQLGNRHVAWPLACSSHYVSGRFCPILVLTFTHL